MVVGQRKIGETDMKRIILAALVGVLVGGPTLTHPAKSSSSAALRDLDQIPSAGPLLRPVRSDWITYNRLACQQACEQIGIWDTAQEVRNRLVNTCKIGCNLGQKYCS